MADKPSTLDEQVLGGLAAIPDTEWNRADTNDGSTRFVTGLPIEVAVDVTDIEVRVSLWAAEWTSPHEIQDAPELVGRIDFEAHGPQHDEESFASALQHLVEAARILRQMNYVTCQFCGGVTPPEHQYDDRTCQSCASKEYGVVY